MTTDHPAGAWKGGDPRLVKAADGPRYSKDAPGAVGYVPITNSTTTLGYLWFDDEHDAAYYSARPAAGAAGTNAGIVWVGRLVKARAQGFLPSAAVAAFASLESNESVGRVQLDLMARAQSLEELKVIASK